MTPEQSGQSVELVSQPLGMGQLFQTFFSLLLVILLIIGVAWVLRRSGRFGSALGGQLRAVGGLSLGGRDRILLVDAGGTHILIGISPAGIRTLHVFDQPLELSEEYGGGAPPFSDTLQKILRKQEKSDE
jgi:flagellar protein FliO/FliZ